LKLELVDGQSALLGEARANAHNKPYEINFNIIKNRQGRKAQRFRSKDRFLIAKSFKFTAGATLSHRLTPANSCSKGKRLESKALAEGFG